MTLSTTSAGLAPSFLPLPMSFSRIAGRLEASFLPFSSGWLTETLPFTMTKFSITNFLPEPSSFFGSSDFDPSAA